MAQRKVNLANSLDIFCLPGSCDQQSSSIEALVRFF